MASEELRHGICGYARDSELTLQSDNALRLMTVSGTGSSSMVAKYLDVLSVGDSDLEFDLDIGALCRTSRRYDIATLRIGSNLLASLLFLETAR